MNSAWGLQVSDMASFPDYKRSIIFKERNNERIFDATTDEILAVSCLTVLAERYSNPIWGYCPKQKDLTGEEKEFIEFMETNFDFLPILLQRLATSVKTRIESRVDIDSDPDWTWYNSVESLLALPQDIASSYKVAYKGRLVPTAYYLILQRQHFPNENFVIVTKES